MFEATNHPSPSPVFVCSQLMPFQSSAGAVEEGLAIAGSFGGRVSVLPTVSPLPLLHHHHSLSVNTGKHGSAKQLLPHIAVQFKTMMHSMAEWLYLHNIPRRPAITERFYIKLKL